MNKVMIYGVYLLVSVCLFSGCASSEPLEPKGMEEVKQEKKNTLGTENFIASHLLDEETGLIQTNVAGEEGSDLFLSESLGLWMEYLVIKKDDALFEQGFRTLKQQYITNEQLIRWRINEDEDTEVNALIDDLRIIEALFQHGENTGHDGYVEQATHIAESVYTHHFKDGFVVDFYDVTHDFANDELTLSYLYLQAFKRMNDYEVISTEEWDTIYSFAEHLPLKNGFYPKSYNVVEETYAYDETVHMIDQLYIAYHFEPFDIRTDEFFSWLKETYEKDGKIYGRYDAETKERVVDYESAAVYALSLMYSLERGEEDLSTNLYESMLSMQTKDDSSEYKGGYVYTNEQGNVVTHSFDNLLPLLAERKYLDEQDIQ